MNTLRELLGPDLMDTLVWLVNFPATHGYVLVFIAGFSLMGLGMRSFRNSGHVSPRLDQLRAANGEEIPRPSPVRIVAGSAQMWVYRLLALVIIGGRVIGVISLIKGPVTGEYIAEHGLEATGTMDVETVTFTAADGRVLTQPYDFFTQPLVPSDGYSPSSGDVTIRYLEGHPQAYVVIAEDDPWGE
jgi:hypothetical protein